MATRLADLGLPPAPITTPTEDGGVVVEFPSGEPLSLTPQTAPHGANLVEFLDEGVVKRLYSQLVDEVEDDITSKTEWEETAKRALDLLGLKILDNKKSSPDGISQATDTLLLETLLTWQATAYAETMPLSGPAKASLAIGIPPNAPPQARQQARAAVQRAEDYINALLTQEIADYAPCHDQMLFDLGLLGAGFKKIYPDPSTPAGLCIETIRPEDLATSYHSKGLKRGRVTHRTRLSELRITQLVDAGLYVAAARKSEPQQASSQVEERRDDQIGQKPGSVEDEGEYLIYETHDDLAIEGDEHPESPGRARPYVVTLDTTTQAIRAIYRNWREGDPFEARRSYFVGYSFLPAKSLVFGYGLGHLVGNTTNATQDSLRRTMDAAIFANHPAGFKTSNLAIRDEKRPLEAGEFRDVDAPTGNVRESFAELPFKGPSAALVELRGLLREDGRRVAGQAQINIAETLNSQTPVGTAIAALDEAAKIPGSIQRRVWNSLADELKTIREVLLDVLPPGEPIYYGDEGKYVLRGDLQIAKLEPAMRPGSPTKTHRVVEAQTILQLAAQFPQLHNPRAAIMRAYDAFGIHEPEELLAPEPGQAQPSDPITEMTNALAGKPVMAGWSQDHDAHIQAHAAQMQMLALDPSLGEAAASASGALQAHIADHFAKRVSVQAAMQIGIPLEALAQGIPPDLEVQIAPAVAEAMQQILEQMPKPPDPANAQLQIAQLKEAGAEKRDQRKAALQMAIAQLRARTDNTRTATTVSTNNADNETALAIAGLRGIAQPNTRPSAPANDHNPRPGGGF